MTEFKGFPSPAGSSWPGAWHHGVDFSGGSPRVIAVLMAGGAKYDTTWIGPIALTAESAAGLSSWAAAQLNIDGGYVHLFPADGDGAEELAEWAEEDDDGGSGGTEPCGSDCCPEGKAA